MKSIMKKYQQKFENFKYVIGKDNPIIIEIGSHYGEDSLRFVETFKNSKVYCFEPDPRCIAVFKKYIQNDRITLFEIALSNENGTAEFYQSYDDSKSNFVPEKYVWIDIEDYKNNKLSNSGSSSLKAGYKQFR